MYKYIYRKYILFYQLDQFAMIRNIFKIYWYFGNRLNPQSVQYQFANNGSNHVIRKISCVLNRIKTHQETFTIKDAAAYGTVMDLFESINQIHTCLSSPPASFQGLLCCNTWLDKSFGWRVCWSNHFLNSCFLEVILNNAPAVFKFNAKNMTNQYLQHDQWLLST